MRDFSSAKILAKHSKSSLSILDRLGSLTKPSQLPAIRPHTEFRQVRFITRSMAKLAQNLSQAEDEAEQEIELYGSDDSELSLTDCVNVPAAKIPYIDRPTKYSHDMDRNTMFKEIKDNMVVAGKSDFDRAQMAHSTFHLPRTTLVEYFGISKSQADQIVKNCHCGDKLAPNRHPRHPERSHTKSLGPDVECSCDVLHMANNQYIIATKDKFSGYIRLTPLKRLTTDSVFTGLLKMHMSSGLPAVFRTDGAKGGVKSQYRNDYFIL